MKIGGRNIAIIATGYEKIDMITPNIVVSGNSTNDKNVMYTNNTATIRIKLLINMMFKDLAYTKI